MNPAAAPPWLARGLDANLMLRAGAGTGKTHALVTLALGLLVGFRRRQKVEPAALWLLTFGEQAAGELRLRLRLRLEPLAAGRAAAEVDPELALAAQALGVPLPTADAFRLLLERLSEVRASTIHGACAAILREFGGGGLAGFGILDAAEADELLTQAAKEAILEAVTGEAQGLLEDFGYAAAGQYSQGLVEALRSMHRQIAEQGSEPPDLEVVGSAAAQMAQVLADCRSLCVQAALDLDCPALARAATVLSDPAGVEAAFDEILAATKAIGRRTRGKAKEAKAALKRLEELLGEARAERHTPQFRSLLRGTERRYTEAKARRQVLDYADLCSRTRDLLRSDPGVRREVKARVGALLVDETQDTNRVQLEICLLLAETRGAEAVIEVEPPLEGQLSLEPGALFAVGDRKQSIYEFRGGNVVVFDELSRAIAASGGRAESLSVSRRSHPTLVEFVNRFFAAAMAGESGGLPGFGPGDALQAHRSGVGLPGATLIALAPLGDGATGAPSGRRELAADARLREAQAVGARIADLLGRPPSALREALGRPLQPGDVALLFRRRSHFEVFRAALAAEGIASAVLGGDGFWEAQEVLDAAALFAGIVDPDDGLAALTLLRSPLCGVRDATLARLLFHSPARRLSLKRLGEDLPDSIAGEERQRLQAFGRTFDDLRQAARGLGAAGVLRAAESQLGLRAAQGDPQASANLDKLERRVAAWQSGGATVARVARKLRRLTRERPRESLADAVDAADKGAVRLLTIHAAKGLEFPVVFVTECGSATRHDTNPSLYSRAHGLALKGRTPRGEWRPPAAYVRADAEIAARSAAEELRLLYVAATRAEELLFFSGEPTREGKQSWRGLLDLHGPAAGLAIEGGSREELALTAAPAPSAPRSPASEAIRATAPLAPCMPSRLQLAASAASDLLLCARRFQLRQLWQLPEADERFQRRVPDELPPDDDPRALGSLAHRLLEVVDLPTAAKDLEGALRLASALASSTAPDPEVLGEVRAVLGSELGRTLRALPVGQVRREVPFVLRLGTRPPLVLTGSIDLLLVLDGRVLVVDYKRGPVRETATYRAQVEIYALAAAELTGHALPVEGGLWFLREAARGPRSFPVSPQRLIAIERELGAAAATIAGLDARRVLYPGVPPSRCRALGCGYLARCHPTAAVPAGAAEPVHGPRP